ncbi:MAG TPA: asparagine synthase (glutamine-hydrolyzing) [Candidatus Moranbacteria bacterium]|nr:asparagine synthase (glutamine-hydrolyzing) [Candidatus Moranbacteria bacterium]HAT74666.1 asparagine synthase (glutamine-hydrolyzing) [Candidatus Moranbacteria bacterium]
MCGILGQINRKISINEKLFQKMLSTLEKRGPDQSGYFFDNKIALGQRRLSIIDLSEAGRQPLFNENKNIAIVFNGEIYNYQAIKNNLKNNHIWQSKTDTEVLIHSYEEYGQKIMKEVEGMFAFAIYDKQNQLITLARDHFGKKPLYYYLDDEFFCFASELKAIIKNLEIKKKLKVDQLSLTKYLFYGYIPSPNSIFDKIKKLEPSTTFQFDIKNWKIINKHQYWQLENIKINKNISEKEILEKTENLIKKSVKKRLMSDVPLGIFLSGGVDSSLITKYLSEYSPQTNSFTVCYKNSKESDESQYAQRVAKKLGINYNLCYFEDQLVRENFLEILDYLDEPMADAALIPLYYISKFAKDKITVVLSGDGGDEIFGGYYKYKAQKIIENSKYLSFLFRIGEKFISQNNSYYKLLKSFDLNFSARQFIFGSGSFLPEEAEKILKQKINLETVFEEAQKYETYFQQKDTVNKSLFLDCKIQLPDWYLVKGDRATMANSLEMRNPLLDKDLAEFAFSLSGNWKIKNGEQKYILKKLASKYFDKDLVYRKKSGFGVPLDKWIGEELRDLFQEYLFIDNGFFDLEYVKLLHSEHMSGKTDHRFKLLRIFNFNYWYENTVNKDC